MPSVPKVSTKALGSQTLLTTRPTPTDRSPTSDALHAQIPDPPTRGARYPIPLGHCSTVALHDRYHIAMSVVIRQSELRNDNAAVMRRVAEGESFVVTVNGRPVADVVPHQRDTGRRRFVPVAEVAEAFATELVRDPKAWQTDLADADEIFGLDEPTDPFEWRRH